MSRIVEENLSGKDRYRPEDFKIKLVDPVRDEKDTDDPLSSGEVQRIVNFVTDALDEAGVVYKEVRELPSGAAQICLTECLWGDEHSDNKRGGADAFVNSDGTLGFYCFHSHCQGRDWAVFRAELEERAGHRLKFGESGEDKVIVSKPVSVEEYKEMIAEQQPQETTKQASVVSNGIGTDNSEIVLTDAGGNVAFDLNPDEVVPPYNKNLVRGFYADAVDLIAGGTTMPVQFPHLLSKTYLGLRMAVQGVYLQDCEAETRVQGLLIAEKGGSKGWSEKRTRKLFTCFDKVEPGDQQAQRIKILDGVDSGAGLKEAFFDHPADAGILLYIDETADLGAKVRSDRNPEIFTTILTLADNTRITRSKAKREDRKSKHDARLAMVMCVQPDIIPVAFAGVKAGPLGLWSRLTLEYSSPVEPGREPKMEDRKSEIEKFYAKYLLLDFSKVRINQNDRARKRLEDYWNSLPPNERTEIRRKKNMYVNQFLIQAGQMAGCKELKNVGETTLQDAADAIEDDIRQNIIRRLYLSTEITDNVSGYLAKLKAITNKQREAIQQGAVPESVALTQRDYCNLTHGYRDNEEHFFDRAWRVFTPMYLITINKAQKGGRKTVWYVPKP
jgi:hypothetical protein